MSGYRNFYPCIICRTRALRREYSAQHKDDEPQYEVTLLLNTLYLTSVLFVSDYWDKHGKAPDDKPFRNLKFSKTGEWLKDHPDCITVENDELCQKLKEDPANIIPHFRHVFAHFNIKTETKENCVDTIELASYHNDKQICAFKFSPDHLRDFVACIENEVIEQLPKLLEELDKNVPEQAFSCVGCPLSGTLGVKEWEQGD